MVQKVASGRICLEETRKIVRGRTEGVEEKERERTRRERSINVPASRRRTAVALESRGDFCSRVSRSGGLIARITGLARVRGCLGESRG